MEPFLGEIRVFAYGVTPSGWAQCNGQILTIASNTALYSLLGNRFGGDGKVNFALPDLRGATMIDNTLTTNNYPFGTAGGAETVTLTAAQIPPHGHVVKAVNSAATTQLNSPEPAERFAQPNILGAQSKDVINLYVGTTPTPTLVALIANTIGTTGGAPHDNMPPFLTLNVCIAVKGDYPPRN